MLVGHVGDEPVLLSRSGSQVFAIGGKCTHYGGPLGEGLVVGATVRCPWHHACFDLRTGEATHAPALNPVSRWEIIRDGALVKVGSQVAAGDGATAIRNRDSSRDPESIVIIGAGAAGNAAAEMLRREGYRGRITMVGRDESVPYDRPNLSKDYLAGNAPEEWIPLRPREFYDEHSIELITATTVSRIDVGARRVELADGNTLQFDRLLLATGADPVRPPIPGADLEHVHYLRTLADSRAIIAAAGDAKKAVVIGASFIGLEVAASLRARGLSVDVVAPEGVPLERVLGAEMGAFVKATHESEGVTFHLGRKSTAIDRSQVTLDDGTALQCDIVVVGVGGLPLRCDAEPGLLLAEHEGDRADHDDHEDHDDDHGRRVAAGQRRDRQQDDDDHDEGGDALGPTLRPDRLPTFLRFLDACHAVLSVAPRAILRIGHAMIDAVQRRSGTSKQRSASSPNE